MTAADPAVLEGPRPPRARRAEGDGGTTKPSWERPAFWTLLVVAAITFLWDLSASGYANEFYSAATQASAQSWKALLFGSSDAGNSITVDKPPAFLWPMDFSVRLFGLGSWQILVPEALMGVASVGVLYAAVRRLFGPGAALLAGTVLMLTPVAAMMFRFNNPDALLTLLMVCALYCFQRALEGDRAVRWMLLTGVSFGIGFLTKSLEAWVILPALTVVYLVCAAAPLRKRISHVALAGAAIVVSGGWWVAIDELWPADSRPYVGGSRDNDFLSLTFGYNGLDRLTGSTGAQGGVGGVGFGSSTGITRLFNTTLGGQISWLLPAALILLVAALVATRRAARTDRHRAAFLAWGGALLCTAVTFSFMSGTFHEYYTIVLAPYIAAVFAMGTALLWRQREHIAATAVLAVTVATTAVWAFVLLGRVDGWLPWLRWTVLIAGILATGGLFLVRYLAGRPRLVLGAAALALVAVLAGPAGFTWATVTEPHTGATPLAGPATASNAGTGRGAIPAGGPTSGAPAGGFPGAAAGGSTAQGGAPGAGGAPAGGFPGAAAGGGTAQGGAPSGAGTSVQGVGPDAVTITVTPELTAALVKNADDYTWVAATDGAHTQNPLQLAIGVPVMPIGGYTGMDPSPTLAQFQKDVAAGEIHYFVGGDTGTAGRAGVSTTSSQIASWVAANYTAQTIGGTTVYDLTAPKSGS